ncbi:amino acid adenylation domain-containing protein [Leptolyngbya sp. BC1307]|uniref:non-ribosomal peptide synthetase family protein n=1 Tax=Leptolyngbya sp. BC1307 TaxID=2029589 RepID=UPI000EFD7776|nr:amino acid adenylation domain-containing protein [Leptolyngbya sp. BC1307]
MKNISSGRLVHCQFEAQVARTPEAIALIDQGRQFTYQQLNAKANQLAHYLQKQGVGPEVLVGLCIRRSPDLIVSLLAILKAGGAYVPFDPDYPAERLVMMQEDSQVELILTARHDLVGWATNVQIICTDTQGNKIAQEPTENLNSAVAPHHLAYVIYTSGSTGKPKGVMIEHRSLAAYVSTAAIAYAIQPADRVLQFASVNFDTSAEEIYPCLVRGATLVLRTAEMIGSVQSFLEYSQTWGITVWNLPTAFWHFLSTELARLSLAPPASLRLVIIGGEKALPTRLALWRRQVGEQVRLVNTYGPTETTIVATMCDLTGAQAVDASAELPIGKAISQTQLYILDDFLQPVVPGTVGNLYIGGAGVARGYLNRPELTAESFIASPLGNRKQAETDCDSPSAPVSRMYRTGDRVRDRGDGLLEYIGRADHQVKIRGFRVELFEIESVLNQHPTVREGIVLAKRDALGNQRLVAYVLPENNSAKVTGEWVSTLKSHLSVRLPNYMVPALFLLLDHLPLTPNGKVDRRALPEPGSTSPLPDSPKTPLETPLARQIADLWTHVLAIPSVGGQDNFFELGGNSLLAAHLVSLLRETLSIDLPIRCVYEALTLQDLAETIEAIQQNEGTLQIGLTDLKTQAIPAPPQVLIHQRGIAPLATPNAIFLTGATGFLGAFLLYELLQQTQADIYCLIRCDNRSEGLTRLRATFAKYSLSATALDRRLVLVPGYLDKPRFGLSPVQFARLADKIDTIYHVGAMVNFVKPYSALAATNVQGTYEILRLASQGRLKPVNYISTVGVFGATAYFTGLQTVYENDNVDLSRDFLCWDDGYAQTKWAAEKLILAARAQGIPVTIFRPGFIMGHSHTGATNTQDFLSRAVMGCIQIGSYPDLANFKNQIVTVDYASRAIVYLSQQSACLGQTFHLTPWSAAHDPAWNDLFQWITDYGYSLIKRSYADWKDELIHQSKASQSNFLYPLLPFLSEKIYRQELTILELYENTSDFNCQNAINGLRGSRIDCPVIDADLIYTYLSTFDLSTELKQSARLIAKRGDATLAC